MSVDLGDQFVRINTVHGVTRDGVAILGNGGTIYLVDLSV